MKRDMPEKCRRIKELMDEKHITATELSKYCGICASTVIRYANGAVEPSDWRYEEIIRDLEEM